MKTFQDSDSAIDGFDLLLNHRHPLGKVIMLPDFPGKLCQFGFHDCLGDLLMLFILFGGGKAGAYHACQGESSCD